MRHSYRIAVVEDSTRDLAALRAALSLYGESRGTELSIVEYSSVEALLSHYARDFDLIFFDIELPGDNGMEGAKRIRRTDPQVGIIFVTNLARFALEGYQVDALDYVLKPVVYDRFAIKLDRALLKLDRAQGRYILVRSQDNVRKLDVRDIVYVEVMAHTLCYHLVGGEDAVVSGKLGALEDDLSGDGFIRCKSCYLVNLRHVSELRVDDVVMDNGAVLKISRGKSNKFREAFLCYIARGGE